MTEYICIIGTIITGVLCLYQPSRDVSSFKKGVFLCLIITIAYFTFNFFLFALLLLGLIFVFVPKTPISNRLAYFFLILPLIPANLGVPVPFPGLQHLFSLTYPMILSLFILTPLFFAIILGNKRKSVLYLTDCSVLGYYLYMFIMGFRDTTYTNVFRGGVESFCYLLVPYFVFSRALTSTEDFKKIFNSLIFITFILSILGVVETFTRIPIFFFIGSFLTGGEYVVEWCSLGKWGFLRAYGSFFGAPLTFGAYLSAMIGFLVFLKDYDGKKYFYYPLLSVFLFTLLCTFSRGALIGVVALFGALLLLGYRKLINLVPFFVILIFAIVFSPIGQITVSTLPFIGTQDQNSVNYRHDLLINSLEVIKDSPLTGSNNFWDDPRITMPGGILQTGNADIVNQYLLVSLQYGFLGTAFFVAMFFSALFSLWRAFRRAADAESSALGKILFATIVSIMVVMWTVSLTDIHSIYIWSFLGLSTAYAQVINNTVKNNKG